MLLQHSMLCLLALLTRLPSRLQLLQTVQYTSLLHLRFQDSHLLQMLLPQALGAWGGWMGTPIRLHVHQLLPPLLLLHRTSSLLP